MNLDQDDRARAMHAQPVPWVPPAEGAFRLVCPKCGCEAFNQATRFVRVSALVNETGQDQYFAIKALACVKCQRTFDSPARLKTGGAAQAVAK